MDTTNVRGNACPDNSCQPFSLGKHDAVVASYVTPSLRPRSAIASAVNHHARSAWLSTCPDLLDPWEVTFLARVGGVARLSAEEQELLHEVTNRVTARGVFAR